jgi:arabinofuranan 3-O-arabinosyltransferase
MKITYGWSLMLIVVFCALYFRYLDAKAENRLGEGIDPPWLAKKIPHETNEPDEPSAVPSG